jgi:hypothetical protein
MVINQLFDNLPLRIIDCCYHFFFDNLFKHLNFFDIDNQCGPQKIPNFFFLITYSALEFFKNILITCVVLKKFPKNKDPTKQLLK